MEGGFFFRNADDGRGRPIDDAARFVKIVVIVDGLLFVFFLQRGIGTTSVAFVLRVAAVRSAPDLLKGLRNDAMTMIRVFFNYVTPCAVPNGCFVAR